MGKKDKEELLVFPTVYRFNGNTKKFMRIVNSPGMIKGYEQLLKELGCKPSELSEKLRRRAWQGKSPHEILEEAEKD